MQSDPFDFEYATALWGMRAFRFMGGVAASVVIGYGLVPAISNIAWVVALAFFVCAVFCLLVMIIRYVQWRFALGAENQQVSTKLGASYPRELRGAEKPLWWSRLSPQGKITNSIGVVAFALLVALLRSNTADAILGGRFVLFVVVIALFAGVALVRR